MRLHREQLRRVHGLSATEQSVLDHIATCRTAALGGHVDECEHGDYVRHSYNSCQDRNCPKCQSLRQQDWIAKRSERLLPVAYFHVVFTIPHELNALTLRNKKLVYRLLFAAASQSLQEMTRDPRHLGADIGITAVLHSWGQNLSLHPHLHCVVTGGGLARNGERWVEARTRRGRGKRFLMHIVPKGFHRIRHYGLFASANVNRKLVVAKRLLKGRQATTEQSDDAYDPSLSWWERYLMLTGIDLMRCPRCGGRLLRRALTKADAVPVPSDARGPPRAA